MVTKSNNLGKTIKHDITKFAADLQDLDDHRDPHLVMNLLKANHIEKLRKAKAALTDAMEGTQ